MWRILRSLLVPPVLTLGWLGWLVAQPTAPAPSWIDTLGPFVAFGGLAMVVIYWQAKEGQRKDARIEHLTNTIADKTTPAITDSNRVLAEAVQILREQVNRRRDQEP